MNIPEIHLYHLLTFIVDIMLQVSPLSDSADSWLR